MAIYTLLGKRLKLLNALQGLLVLYKRSWDLLFNNRNARTALPSPRFYTISPIDSFCLSQPTRRKNSPSVHRGSTALAGREFAQRVTFC